MSDKMNVTMAHRLAERIGVLTLKLKKEIKKQGVRSVADKLGLSYQDVHAFVHDSYGWSIKKILESADKLGL